MASEYDQKLQMMLGAIRENRTDAAFIRFRRPSPAGTWPRPRSGWRVSWPRSCPFSGVPAGVREGNFKLKIGNWKLESGKTKNGKGNGKRKGEGKSGFEDLVQFKI